LLLSPVFPSSEVGLERNAVALWKSLSQRIDYVAAIGSRRRLAKIIAFIVFKAQNKLFL